MPPKISNRERYKARLANLINSPPINADEASSESEILAHWAKYNCILISGYIEQSIKEIIFEYTSAQSSPAISKYVEGTWPKSKNMKCSAIKEILSHLNEQWGGDFESWQKTGQNKKDIDDIIIWRNRIAHGAEAQTTNVTIHSVKEKFSTACNLVTLLEGFTGQN